MTFYGNFIPRYEPKKIQVDILQSSSHLIKQLLTFDIGNYHFFWVDKSLYQPNQRSLIV
jgi:hypothetical protein